MKLFFRGLCVAFTLFSLVAAQDVNECTLDTDNCDVHATCTNTVGSFTCVCNTGYTGSGLYGFCPDRDECALNIDTCASSGSTCVNTDGSFTCSCSAGYSGTGLTCSDVNECTTSTHNCGSHATCTNTVGSFTCACNTGYSGVGTSGSCTEIDECTAGTSTCASTATCANTAGSFTCTCNTGYSGAGTTCSEVDECTSSTHNCDGHATCTNTVASFTCACNTGYSGAGTVGSCSEINECSTLVPCGTNAACKNSHGSFTCTCNAGYSGDGYTCADVNECTLNTDNCGSQATCTNTVGSFTCGCVTGFTGAGTFGGCTENNECNLNTDTCADTPGLCSNTFSSFSCSCGTGYSGTGLTCSDVDECTLATDNCDDRATCANTAGSFTCACNTGYTGTGTTATCLDTDECSVGAHSCGSSLCTNTKGSFTCAAITCSTGYTEVEGACADVNECTSSTDDCDASATCTNTEGSFTCACNSGYSGSGTTCTASGVASGTGLSGDITNYALTVNSFSTTGYFAIDHDGQTGDDKGGVGISGGKIFITGDNGAIAATPPYLSDVASSPLADVLPYRFLTELVNERMFEFCGGVSGGLPIQNQYTHLCEFSGTTGWTGTALALTGASMAHLSEVYDEVGIFSGRYAALVYAPITSGGDYYYTYGGPTSAQYFMIDLLPSSPTYLRVTQLSETGALSMYGCEDSANSGVLSVSSAGVIKIIYRDDDILIKTVDTTGTGNGSTSTFLGGTDLSDMCTFVLDLSGYWCFHYESGGFASDPNYSNSEYSYYGGYSESAGCMPATFTLS